MQKWMNGPTYLVGSMGNHKINIIFDQQKKEKRKKEERKVEDMLTQKDLPQDSLNEMMGGWSEKNGFSCFG